MQKAILKFSSYHTSNIAMLKKLKLKIKITEQYLFYYKLSSIDGNNWERERKIGERERESKENSLRQWSFCHYRHLLLKNHYNHNQEKWKRHPNYQQQQQPPH